MSNESQFSRRKFLSLAAAVPATLALGSLPAHAAGLPHLTPDNPTAKSLSYVEDASKIDAKAQPIYKAGSACASCALYSGKPGDAYGPCGLFAGYAVSSKGWCQGYNKKA